jgi:hypothetical protein
VARGLAAVVFAAGIPLAAASSAGAAGNTVATPAPPTINSATASGGTTLVDLTNPPLPAGFVYANTFLDNGKPVDWNSERLGGTPEYGFPSSLVPAGSTIQAKVVFCTGDPDNGTQQCAVSGVSDGVVVK